LAALLYNMDDPRPINNRLSVEFTRAKQEEQDRLSFSREDGGLPDFHRISLSDLRSQFDVPDISLGLTAQQVIHARTTYGLNVISPPKRNPLWMWLGFFFGGFNGFLWFAAAVSWLAWGLGYLNGGTPSTGNLTLAVALVIVVLINIAVSVVQDHTSSAVMKSIKGMMPQYSMVVRDGQAVQILTQDLVPGDILQMQTGDRIPADVRVLSVSGLKVDQSILTGESEPIALRSKMTSSNYLESKNMTFCGGCIVDGSGTGLVVATGNYTMMGSLAVHAANDKKKETYLSKEIRRAIIIIASLCFITAAACFITYVAWLRTSKKGFINWPGIVGICLGVLVAYLPEGVPLCVVVTLFIVAKRMARRNVLVKDLTIIETLGSINMIASDKTGTLTQNKMSVVDIVLANGEQYPSPSGFHKASRQYPNLFEQFVDLSMFCNAATFDPATEDLAFEERTVLGGASDIAIFKFGAAYVEDVQETRSAKPLVTQIPFNSKNKYMVTIHETSISNAKKARGYLVMNMKGAAESMIGRCVDYLKEDGSLVPMTPKYRARLLKLQVEMCKKGQRVLGMIRKSVEATPTLPIRDAEFNPDEWELPIENGFTFIGLIALMDPPREEVPQVIEKCHQAGIKVAMVTGDHPDTAVTIAKMIGIVKGNHVSQMSDFVAHALPAVDPAFTHTELNRPTIEFFRDDEEALVLPRAVVITGPELLTFDAAKWEWALGHRDLVFARTSPENKLEIVKQMQARGYSVAVTGDGVNDSPALKQADVGVAMGGGSDVAKEAGAIILTDNNFKSLLAGVENGRLVFANLKKVFRYLLPAGTFAEILPVLMNLFLGLPLPLSTFLMIYICVITDVAPCLSLVFEKNESDVMNLPPRSSKAHLLDGMIYLQAYGFSGVIEALCAFTMYFYYMGHYAGIPMSKLWLAYEKYNTTPNVITTYPNPKGGFYTGSELAMHLNTAQCVYFAALIVVQLGNLFGAKNQTTSIWKANPLVGPSRNLFLLASIPISLVAAVIAVYVPSLNKVFQTAPIEWEFWFLPLYFALGLFILHEIRKLLWSHVPWGSLKRVICPACCRTNNS
jgi:sodium/potassium-transporting ATPase subunit alpha